MVYNVSKSISADAPGFESEMLDLGVKWTQVITFSQPEYLNLCEPIAHHSLIGPEGSKRGEPLEKWHVRHRPAYGKLQSCILNRRDY